MKRRGHKHPHAHEARILHLDAHLRGPQRWIQHRAHIEFVRDFGQIDLFALEEPRGGACRDVQIRNRRQGIEQLFGETEEAQRDYSPVAHVAKGKNIPPFLILHVADRADTKAQSQWLADKKIRVIAQLGLVPNKKLPGVPMAIDLMTDEADRNVFELIVLPKEFGRPFIAPPGIPTDRAAALRKAFDDPLADPAFIADAARVHLTIDPMEPDEIARWLDRAYAVPKEQAARAGKFRGVQ